MNKLYMYADESCHIQNDGNNVMSLVTVYCKDIHRKLITNIIKEIVKKHGIDNTKELKWNKVSNNNLEMYKEIFTFLKRVSDAGDIGIRSLVAVGKKSINGDYNTWYHKMYFLMFKYALDDNMYRYSKFHILIDRKDNNSDREIPKIGSFLTRYTYDHEWLMSVGADSKEHILMQISDIIAGSLTYYHRKLISSPSKIELINHIQKTFGVNYSFSTRREIKPFNIFIWSAKYANTKKDQN